VNIRLIKLWYKINTYFNTAKPAEIHQLKPLGLTKTFIEKCNEEIENYFEKISSQQLFKRIE